MSYGILLIIAPPFCLIWMACLLGIAFAVIYAGKKIFRIRREDIAHPEGSLVPLVFTLWSLSVAALMAAFAVVLTLSMVIPWLGVVHSEWGIAYEKAYLQAAVYIGGWVLLYAALLMPVWLVFRKRLLNRPKARRLFCVYVLVSSACWAAAMFAVFV